MPVPNKNNICCNNYAKLINIYYQLYIYQFLNPINSLLICMYTLYVSF